MDESMHITHPLIRSSMLPLTWFVWAFAGMVIALGTRNPLYLALLLLVVMVVREPLRTPTQRGISIVQFALFAIPVSALFNALSVHFGDTVLFVIPGNVPVFSGAVTLEALVYGATNGLMLTTVLAVFSTLNLAVAPREWMRFAPRSYQSIGMTMSIALSLVPQISKRMRDVREAQAIRGHHVRGLRDWLPLWMPLLTGGLEQSMQLSEAIVARGFGAAQAEGNSLSRQVLLVVGLAVLMGGWLAQMLWPSINLLGVMTMLCGAGVVVVSLFRSTRASPRTTYHDQRLTVRDLLIILACVLALVIVFAPALLGQPNTLAYYPYPALSLPQFNVAVGVGLLLLLGPVLNRNLISARSDF